ncbi:MAG: hypothetical protein ABSH38_05300 [Verrucomicrobiota bacterium]|jgi:hypothetical protein
MNTKNSRNQSAAALLASLVLLGGCQKQQEIAPPAPSAPTESIVSAEKTCFDPVTAKLNRGGNLYVFLDTEGTMSGLSNRLAAFSNLMSSLPNIPGEGRANLGRVSEFLNDFVHDSGLGQISGLGMSSIAREKGFYYGKVVVFHHPGQNAGLIWSLFGKAPHPLRGLDLLPESTALAIFSDFDLPLAWTNIELQLAKLDIAGVAKALDQVPAQFHQQTGLQLDDVLRSLGGEYGLIFTLDEHKKITLPIPGSPLEIPNPGLAIVVKVNSDVIFNRVDEALNANPVVSKLVGKVEDGELKMRTVTLPIPLPLDLRPSIARSGDYLFLATSDTLVRDLLAVKSGEKKGYKATDEFKKLSQGIPNAGNNFALVTGAFGNTISQVQQQALSSQQGGAQGAQSLKQLLNTGTNTYSYSVGVNGAEGWEGFANGNHSLQSVLLPVTAAAGLAAGIAIPNFIKARQTSQSNAILDNLRRLDSAKEQWVLEKGKKPGDSVTMDDLAPYLGGKGIEQVVGEKYLIHPVGQPPTVRLAQDLSGHKAGSEISLRDITGEGK